MGSFFCCSMSSKTQSCESVANVNANGDRATEEKEQLVSEKSLHNFAENETHAGSDTDMKSAEHYSTINGLLSENNTTTEERPSDTNGLNGKDFCEIENKRTDSTEDKSHNKSKKKEKPSDSNDINGLNGKDLCEIDGIESESSDSSDEDETHIKSIKGDAEPKADIKLTESELTELTDIFRMFDKDNSGSIDVTELETMVSSLGIAASKEDLNDMIAEADVDNSGTIEFDEFKVLIGPHFQKEKPPEDFVDAFKFFDKDGDGYISRSELRTIMSNVDNNLAEADIEDMIKEADANGDGKIDFEEFTKMMQNQQ